MRAKFMPAAMRKYVTAWFAMLLVAMANGALRDLTYGKYVDELSAHQLSTLIGVPLLGVVIWQFIRRHPPASGREALAVGLFWMSLTVAFEFLFFHYVGGRSWSDLLGNYNLARGRVWVIVLAWVAISPYWFFRLMPGYRHGSDQ